MKVLAVLSLVTVALAGLLDKRECAANNCIRAVTGTRNGDAAVTSHKSDCSSYQLTVVTPPAVTTTVTVEDDGTAPTASKRAEFLEYRQVTAKPTSVPSYATACADAGEFGSACSCWGITATVSTAPTPTVTVTSTVDTCDEL